MYKPISVFASAYVDTVKHSKIKENMKVTAPKRNNIVSIIVPIYNEKGNIAAFHKELLRCLASQKRRFEVIYIDDHSNDGTFEWLQKMTKEDNLHVFLKVGKKGKAFSLLEGFAKAKGQILVMIDGDMQYPPDAILPMIKQLKKADVVVADRKEYRESRVRKYVSSCFRFFFARFLLGLSVDIQAGLKVFKREVLETVQFTPNSGWTFDSEFLRRAMFAGFDIQGYAITFAPRTHGQSKIHLFKGSIEIGLNALAVRMKKLSPLTIAPHENASMLGAGVGYKKRKYITHTTLPLSLSSMQTFSLSQKIFLGAIAVMLITGLLTFFLPTLRVIAAILSVLYFIDTLFNVFLVMRSLEHSSEIQVTDDELSKLSEKDLPVYTVLCPLYKEIQVLPQFLEAIAQLDYPKDKLDIMLLLEEDDKQTIAEIYRMHLPSYVRPVIVPDSQPKTKPKACNYGLSLARGDYLVIYDAEDIPDPLQLKKAYLGFKKADPSTVCLQAKLNYYNPRQNLLTRFFTAEYSLWFDLTLTGLQSFNSTIPLGGTSNHFKIAILRSLQGWDPFNVTEDADLGIRLFQQGYRTAIIDSTTYEEATSKSKNWLRQRSRWIKGYMQTYLVHTRNIGQFVKKKGFMHNIIFQLTVGGKLFFILINPCMWLITILYFTSYRFFGPLIEAIYVPPISYIAVFSWIFGNFLFLYCYMIACSKRAQWDLMKYIIIIPVYWCMMSFAAMVALYQLIFKPHYWEKTFHGFHLQKKKQENAPDFVPSPVLPQPAYVVASTTGTTSITSTTPRRDPLYENEESLRSEAEDIQTRGTRDTLAILELLPLAAMLSFLLLDQFLAGRLLDQSELKTYLLLSLTGKTLYIFLQTTAYLFAEIAGRKKRMKSKFHLLIFLTFLFQWIGFVIFGLEGKTFIPLVFHGLLLSIMPYSLFYLFGIMCFALANVFVFYYAEKKNYSFAVVSLAFTLIQAYFFQIHHEDMNTIMKIFAYLGSLDLLAQITLQANFQLVQVIENNIASLFAIFTPAVASKAWEEKRLRILIFNWRDTKHVYAGGAEVYVHELAKRWVEDGNKVTLFCGNDNKNPSYEAIDGVEIYRRGGTYTVYLFAMFYYLVKFHGKYDVVIDCENGIPFFTPLFVRKPIILLIHHVHQEVFREFLRFPLNRIAEVLEGKCMPLFYKNKKIVTVSESSKKEIIKLGFIKSENVAIVHNGVSEHLSVTKQKTEYPSFLYLGRLKHYKNVDIAIKAFAQIVEEFPHARLSIVGTGEMQSKLKKLVAWLQLGENVDFLGKVSEEEKGHIFAQSWVVLQPSQIEGWGITVIEANAAGTPVIASRVSGLIDSIVDGRTGLLVDPGSVKQFALAMRMLVRNDKYRLQLSNDAYIWSKKFTWTNSAQAFYQLIGRSLGQPSYAPIPSYPKFALSRMEANQIEAA